MAKVAEHLGLPDVGGADVQEAGGIARHEIEVGRQLGRPRRRPQQAAQQHDAKAGGGANGRPTGQQVCEAHEMLLEEVEYDRARPPHLHKPDASARDLTRREGIITAR